ncbi:ICOS ligand [Microcaecilia unicolor]|uniref:ICOS ligand-like n=1 Tax=Microcaecilia unicolor TaxID=1415580 RepID=A0A6P7Y015_9AMPH|nr:ICOS ligand-like [Microcaecilia unicolor]
MKSPRAQTWILSLILMELQTIATGVASHVQIKCNVGENITLPCVFPEVQSLPLTDIRVSWQTHSDVLMFLNYGTVEYDHVTDRYRGRTDFLGEYQSNGNFSLLLAGVDVRDEEEVIHCYIQVKESTGFALKYSSEVQLEVSGSFSQPLLEGPGHNSYTCKDRINATCTSIGEYPKPQVEWTINQKKHHDHNVTLDRDLNTKLFNVISTMTITASVDQTVQCSIKNTRNQKTRHSVLLRFPKCTNISSTTAVEKPARWRIALGVLGVVLLLALIGVAIFIIFIQKSRCPSSRDPANVQANGSTSVRINETPLLLINHSRTSNNTN